MSTDPGGGPVDFSLFTCSLPPLIFSLTPLALHLPPLLFSSLSSRLPSPNILLPDDRPRSLHRGVKRHSAVFLLFVASHPIVFVFHCSCQNCQPALSLSSPSLPLPLTLHLPVFPLSALYHLLSAEGRNAARRPQSRHRGRKNTE